MGKDEVIAKINEVCAQCKAGSPLRFRPETGEWIHEHLRVNTELRSTAFSQVYCLATPLRVEHQDLLNG